jgi:trimeric autotransporter adhesin
MKVKTRNVFRTTSTALFSVLILTIAGLNSGTSLPDLVMTANAEQLDGTKANTPVGDGPLSGIYGIPGDFPTLQDAVIALNTEGVSGAVTFQLASGQTAPQGGYVIGGAGSPLLTTTSSTNTFTLDCNGNTIMAANPQPTGATNDGLLKIVGTDHVIIKNCTLMENPANTNTTAGSNNMTEWGIALLYATPTDGAQNVTIKDNTISLNRTYSNSFGIYSNSNHAAATPGTLAAATDPSGSNSNLVIQGNTITNTNQGIVVNGPIAAANHNTGLTIGGPQPGEGNQITNFGIRPPTSVFANHDDFQVSGINIRNTKAIAISGNTLESNSVGVDLSSVNGIFLPPFNNAPTGGDGLVVDENSISLRSRSSGQIRGINIQNNTVGPNSAISITDNTFNETRFTVGGGTGISILEVLASSQNTLISGNIFDGINATNTGGNVFLINASGNTLANDAKNIENNVLTGGLSIGSGGTLFFVNDTGTSGAGSTTTVANNNFSSVSITGSRTVIGINVRNASQNNITGNTLGDISGGTGTFTGIFVERGRDETHISGNEIKGIPASNRVTGVEIGVVGIVGVANNVKIEGNTIGNLSGNSAGVSGTPIPGVAGVIARGGTGLEIWANKFFDLVNTNNEARLDGISISAAVPAAIYNNLIGNLNVPNANLPQTDAVRGISISAPFPGSLYNVDLNTVYLNVSSPGEFVSSAAVYFDNTSEEALRLRNNILVNSSAPAAAGTATALRLESFDPGDLNAYHAASNNNIFFTQANTDFCLPGSGPCMDLTQWKGVVSPRDANSVNENVPIISLNGTDPLFLHPTTVKPTAAESGGVAIPGITFDYAGNLRHPEFPDLGAWEFNGIPRDVRGSNKTGQKNLLRWRNEKIRS